MRALTLTQPWAGLVASGIKLVENRPRKMIKREDFGKPFAIHASKVIDESVYERIAEIAPDVLQCSPYEDGPKWSVPCRRDWYRLSRDTSAVIGVATITSEVFDKSGLLSNDIALELGEQHRWFFGPIGYVLRDVRALATPVPCRGFQGFWTLPADVERQVVEQLR
jgi:hypothetical protein